jgi:GNAT superfamily N-acetyltransferase
MNAIIRDMTSEDVYYVSTCSHVHESDEIDRCGRAREAWLQEACAQGARVKVALLEGRQIGFLYLLPIEISPWGPLGEGLMVIPCLYVQKEGNGRGLGRALLDAAEVEARGQGRTGIVTEAYHHDFWFMPASFFLRHGYTEVWRQGSDALLWKPFDPEAKPPRPLESQYRFEPVPGRVVVDLFWQTFCQTSCIEAQRVREVAAEFGEAVVLRDHSADDRATLLCYQNPRSIYVNGRRIDWGYEAPREGIREAISRAMQSVQGSPSRTT